MEHSDISRRNMLRTGALGVGALGTMSMVSAAAAAPAEAAVSGAVDIFLKINGIPGESRAKPHVDEIDVLGFSWGVGRDENAPKFAKPTLQDLSFVMPVSKASPLLMFASAKGTRLPTAVLTVRKAGEQPVEFYQVTMSDCVVTAYSTSSSSEAPSDSVSLAFKKVTFSYAAQRADGSLEPPIVITYP